MSQDSDAHSVNHFQAEKLARMRAGASLCFLVVESALVVCWLIVTFVAKQHLPWHWILSLFKGSKGRWRREFAVTVLCGFMRRAIVLGSVVLQ